MVDVDDNTAKIRDEEPRIMKLDSIDEIDDTRMSALMV